jgi:16S rRNA (guanine527-N7)-methyltransferase
VFAEKLRVKLAGICSLTEAQVAQLQAHYELLVRWNRAVNLTAVRSEDEIIERHYCESLFLGAHLPSGPLAIADVGSGPGFPGFPVGVLRPDCAVTLIESNQKKATFLREAGRGAGNVRVLASRAEAVVERFDWTISRAVRYGEIGKTLRRLAPNAALLTGELGAKDLPGFDWQPPIRLPWGERRFLFVSRETTDPADDAR